MLLFAIIITLIYIIINPRRPADSISVNDIVLENYNSYESWPKSFYDEDMKILITAYASGPDHGGAFKDIYVSVAMEGKVESYLVVDAGTASVRPIGIFKTEKKYVIIATWAESWVDGISKILRYESDNFTNWTCAETTFPFVTDNAMIINIDNAFLIDGRLFANMSYYEDGEAYICYSDDYGYTWSRSDKLMFEGEDVPCECAIAKIDDYLILLSRKDIPIHSQPVPLYFSFSTDDGKTWAPLTDTQGITDANASNLSISKYSENKIIVMFGTRTNGSAGIYYSITDKEDAKKGKFSTPTIIVEGFPIGDFGYPSCVSTPEGIYFSYYSLSPENSKCTTSVYIDKLEIMDK